MASNEIALVIILFIIWIYSLYILKHNKLTAFYFIIGACGFFGFTFVIFKDILTKYASYALMYILDKLNVIFKWYEVFIDYNIIFINNQKSAISLFVDYECCGIIEILVVLSIVAFIPIFNFKKRIIFGIIGTIYTILANCIRLLFVSHTIYRLGNSYYYIAHSVVGRIIFYILTLILYFYMVTYGQISKQNLGSFEYGDKKEK